MSEDARRARALLGLPIFTIAEGRRLGQIASLLVNDENRTVAAVGISGGPFTSTRHFPFDRLQTIGPDAAMLPSEAAVDPPLTTEEVRRLDGNVPGRSVVTQGGRKLGEVVGFEVNLVSGRIELFRVQPDAGVLTRLVGRGKGEVEVPATLAVSLGADALIVQDEVASLVEAQAAEPEAFTEPPVQG